MTGNWSTSHTGKKYPYYLCQFRGCPQKGKSIRREKLEGQFECLLARLVPAEARLNVAKQMFQEAWELQKSKSAEEAKSLRRKKSKTQKEIKTLVDRLIATQNETVIVAYETRIAELQKVVAVLDEKSGNSNLPNKPPDEMFELAYQFLANPCKIWEKGSLRVKKTILKLVFSDKLDCCRKEGLRTPKTTLPFRYLDELARSDCEMVPPHGLEPRTY